MRISACLTFVTLIASTLFGAHQAGDHTPRFVLRSAFQALPVESEPLRWELGGVAAQDVYALPLAALGAVEGRTVADIGAGRGRHLVGLSKAVGATGSVLVTEISDERCAALQQQVAESSLGNVTVVRAEKNDVGLPTDAIDVALLSDVYQFVMLLDGQSGQDKHAFLTSLHRALAPDGQVVVTYVTSSELKEDKTRRKLLDQTVRDFRDYGFEVGRRWVLPGLHWPVLVLEFRSPREGPQPLGTYLGRELAKPMSYRGAEWLTRPERESEEASTRMLDALAIERGATVVDFGCGNGYHTLEIARRVGPEGLVVGVDIQPEMLELLQERASAAGVENVRSVLGSALSAPLEPGSCDLVLMADVYHELSHPAAILAVLRKALKPRGRIAVLEFRAEDPEVPIKPDHKMTRAQVLKEFEANRFELDGAFDELPQQHLLFFRRAETR